MLQFEIILDDAIKNISLYLTYNDVFETCGFNIVFYLMVVCDIFTYLLSFIQF